MGKLYSSWDSKKQYVFLIYKSMVLDGLLDKNRNHIGVITYEATWENYYVEQKYYYKSEKEKQFLIDQKHYIHEFLVDYLSDEEWHKEHEKESYVQLTLF